jgi:hypothetical protein
LLDSGATDLYLCAEVRGGAEQVKSVWGEGKRNLRREGLGRFIYCHGQRAGGCGLFRPWQQLG